MHKAIRSLIALIIALSLFFSTPVDSSRASSTTVDIAMLTSDPMPVIEAMVNDKGPFRFAIDTGAAVEVLFKASLIERLGIKPDGKTQMGDPSGKNPLAVDTFQLESVAIGNIRFPHVRANRIDLPAGPGGHDPFSQIDGILGFPLFSDYLLTIDYVAGRVQLERESLPTPDGAEVIAFEKTDGLPQMEIDVAGTKVKAHIDSGNTRGYLALPSAMIDKVPLSSEPVVVGKARTVNNEFEIKAATLKGSARIGKHEFPQLRVTFSDISRTSANIGAAILRQFALTFDQKNNRVRFRRKASADAAPTAQSTAVEVPMLFRGPMPAIEVMVNGKGPFLFAIDTGASGAGRVDASLVEKLALPLTGEVRGSDGSGANARSMKLVQVDSL
ncbi:MAG TPA: pepsin/retropepsin-like aspartic protease family protein, partial [Blastocatellia bacterium]